MVQVVDLDLQQVVDLDLQQVAHLLLPEQDLGHQQVAHLLLPEQDLDLQQVAHLLLLEAGCNHLLLEEALVPLDRRFEDILGHKDYHHNLDPVLFHLVLEEVEH